MNTIDQNKPETSKYANENLELKNLILKNSNKSSDMSSKNNSILNKCLEYCIGKKSLLYDLNEFKNNETFASIALNEIYKELCKAVYFFEEDFNVEHGVQFKVKIKLNK